MPRDLQTARRGGQAGVTPRRQRCPSTPALPRHEPFALLPLPSAIPQLPFPLHCSHSGIPWRTSLPAPAPSQKNPPRRGVRAGTGLSIGAHPPPKPFERQQRHKLERNQKWILIHQTYFSYLRTENRSRSLPLEMPQMHITSNSCSLSPSRANPAHRPFLRKAPFTCTASHSLFKSRPTEDRTQGGTGRAGAPNWPQKAIPKRKGAGSKPGQTQEATLLNNGA